MIRCFYLSSLIVGFATILHYNRFINSIISNYGFVSFHPIFSGCSLQEHCQMEALMYKYFFENL
jgi:hypothetical protein